MSQLSIRGGTAISRWSAINLLEFPDPVDFIAQHGLPLCGFGQVLGVLTVLAAASTAPSAQW